MKDLLGSALFRAPSSLWVCKASKHNSGWSLQLTGNWELALALPLCQGHCHHQLFSLPNVMDWQKAASLGAKSLVLIILSDTQYFFHIFSKVL